MQRNVHKTIFVLFLVYDSMISGLFRNKYFLFFIKGFTINSIIMLEETCPITVGMCEDTNYHEEKVMKQ